jgi:geranylgeranyl diphosphate synthase, type I
MTAVDRAVAARPAPEVLADCRAMITPALRAAVDTLPGSVRRVAGYHFGWCDASGKPLVADAPAGGKALRPAVVLLAAEAVGGAREAALPAAVAVELVHNFSLLHDDVMDGDLLRHHRPTAWSVFGTSAAILAGDALLTLALDVLAASGHRAAQGMRMLTGAVLDLVDGQCADVDFERREDVSLAECEAMAARKTGSLLGCAGGLGALFGGGRAEGVDRLRAFGVHLGIAFQHTDDLLGIWGDPAVTGKPIHSDLRSRKKTLPVVTALTSRTPPGRELAARYRAGPAPSGAELAVVAELIERAGGRTFGRDRADLHLDRALRELARVAPPERPGPADRAVAELAALARVATRRDH